MTGPNYQQITKQATATFYRAIQTFPSDVKQDVFVLYAFVRTVDDSVDANPPDRIGFHRYRRLTQLALAGQPVELPLVNDFAAVCQRRGITSQLVADFFAGQALDLRQQPYTTEAELERFIYGVAEVIGLMMAKVMNLPPAAQPAAQQLGRAMQLVNILRDVQEDWLQGKCYFLPSELAAAGIPNWKRPPTPALASFLDRKAQQTLRQLEHAAAGLVYIPTPYLVPITLATAVYTQIVRQILADPLIVFRQRVQLSRWTMLRLYLLALWQRWQRGRS